MQLNHPQATYIQKPFLKLWPGNVKSLVWQAQVSFKIVPKVCISCPKIGNKNDVRYRKKVRDTSIYKISRPLDI